MAVSTLSVWTSLVAQSTRTAISLSMLVTLLYLFVPAALLRAIPSIIGHWETPPIVNQAALLLSPALGVFAFVDYAQIPVLKPGPWIVHTLLHTVLLFVLIHIAKRALTRCWFRREIKPG
jgi:hypothetical protein